MQNNYIEIITYLENLAKQDPKVEHFWGPQAVETAEVKIEDERSRNLNRGKKYAMNSLGKRRFEIVTGGACEARSEGGEFLGTPSSGDG